MKKANARKILKSIRKLSKASKKLEKARKWRIWVEENPHVHLVNYPYYRLKEVYHNSPIK